MPRSAATRSCSTMRAGRVELGRRFVPQNGQTSACLRRIPDRLAAAGGTGELLLRDAPATHRREHVGRRCDHAVTSADEVADHAPHAVGLVLQRHASRARRSFSRTRCERRRSHIRRRARRECFVGIASPACARCDDRARAALAPAFSDSAQLLDGDRVAGTACRRPSSSAAASPRSVSAQPRRARPSAPGSRADPALRAGRRKQGPQQAPTTRAGRANRIGSPHWTSPRFEGS